MTTQAAQPTVAERPGWDRWADALLAWSGYVLLAVSFVLVMAQPLSLRDRLIAIGLTAVAAAWFTLFVRIPACHGDNRVFTLLYFAGFLVIASVLMLHHALFFPVMITGFFQVYVIRPWPLVLLCVLATSLLINTLLAPPPADASDIVFWATIIVVQTLGITGGVVVGQKANDLSEERARTVAELQTALEENAGLHTQLMIQAREAGVLDERQRLAREIHDTLAQGLTGIITQLEAATRAPEGTDGRRRHIDTAMRLARESLADARRSVLALRPESLDGARLPEALEQVAGRWQETSGVDADVTTNGERRPLHPAVEVTLLRVAQEALANVARHAEASRVVLTLSYMDDLVTLDVRDDGSGFSPAEQVRRSGRDGGFGLTVMRQRVDQLSGTLSVETEPGVGTCISASVPALAPGHPAPVGTGGAGD